MDVKKKFEIKMTETSVGFYEIVATTFEEAKELLRHGIECGEYDSPEEFELESYELIGYSISDGKQIEAVYSSDADITFIMEYTYKDGEVVGETVKGFYHGTPDPEMTEEYNGELSAIMY